MFVCAVAYDELAVLLEPRGSALPRRIVAQPGDGGRDGLVHLRVPLYLDGLGARAARQKQAAQEQ